MNDEARPGDAPEAMPTPKRDAAAAPRASYEAVMEQVAREFVRERRSDRRWRIFFRLAWLGLFLAVAWALLVQRTHVAAPTGPHTALIEVRGEIAADTEANAEDIVAALRTAFEDRGAQAVVLRINSPGG